MEFFKSLPPGVQITIVLFTMLVMVFGGMALLALPDAPSLQKRKDDNE